MRSAKDLISHLLDTNTAIEYLRKGAASTVTSRILSFPVGAVCICSVVIGELIYGALRSPPSRQSHHLALIAGLQAQYLSLPFDDAAAHEYGAIRSELAAKGTLIGPNDLLIASIAVSRNVTLVTHNTREFSRVPRLRIEDWQ